MSEKPTYEDLEQRIRKLEQAELELNQTEEELRLSLNAAKAGTWVWDIKSGKVTWDDQMQRFFGLEPGAFNETFEAWRELVHPGDLESAEKATLGALDHCERYENEYRVKGIAGDWRRINAHASTLVDDTGNPIKMIGFATDITKRKEFELRMQRNEALLNATQKLTKVGGWEWDVEKQTHFWTDEVYRIHDFQLSESKQEAAPPVEQSIECYDPEDRPMIADAYERCLEKGEPYDFEVPFTTAKNRRLWIRTVAEPILKGDRVVKIVGNIMDITKRVRAEEALRESEERYRQIFNIAPAAIYEVDYGSGNFVNVNNKMCEYSGYTKDELHSMKAVDLLTEESKISAQNNINKVLSGGSVPENVYYDILKKDGTKVCLDIYNRYLYEGEDIAGVTVVAQDITERKQAEDALRESELRLKRNEALLNATQRLAKIGGWETDLEQQVSFLTDEFYRIHDLEPGVFPIIDEKDVHEKRKIIPDKISTTDEIFNVSLNCYDSEDIPVLSDAYRECMESGKGYDFELPFTTTKGRRIRIRTITNPVMENGKVVKLVGTMQDITEIKQAEDALRKSEELHRLLSEQSVDMIWQMNLDLEITYVNQAVLPILGYTPEEFIGSKLYEHCSAEEMENAQGMFTNNLNKLSTQRTQAFEMSQYHKNGKEIPCEISGKIILDDAGNPIYIQGNTRNITERRQAEKTLRESEEKLVRSKKMESMGLLAGGVAHDLNNVLSGIVSYPELLLMDLPEDSKLREPIKTIQESGHRAAAIVQDLLTVARGVATTKEPLSLNGIVSDYLQSPEFKKLEQFHPTVTIKTNLATDLLNVSGSHVHIRKAVMNLISNASEAIEGSGNIIISTMNRYIDRPLKGYDDINIGEYVILSLSDNGPGISSDDLERIFEPFYTKKVMGRSGTGLGLAVVWNVIQDHKGYIDVTADENGTTFELYFPITRDEVSGTHISQEVNRVIRISRLVALSSTINTRTPLRSMG